MGSDWLIVCCAVTHMTHLMDVKLWFTMSHRGCVTRGDESPGLRLREDAYISGLVATNGWARIISSPPPPIEISTLREIIITFPHAPLFSHEGYYLEVDVKPPSLLFRGLSASPPWGSCFLSSLTRSWSRVLPLTWHLLCTSVSILLGLKASRCVHGRCYSVRLSVEVGLSLLGLYLWWGKSRLVTSRSPLGWVVIPTALSMACFSFVASLFAIRPSSASCLCLLAALLLQELAPYCLMNLLDRRSPPRLRPVVVLHYLGARGPTPWINVITGPSI